MRVRRAKLGSKFDPVIPGPANWPPEGDADKRMGDALEHNESSATEKSMDAEVPAATINLNDS